MTIPELAAITAANGLSLSDRQCSQLEQYAVLLKEKNQVVNLISRKDEDNIVAKHILQSLTIALPEVTGFEFKQGIKVFDIGTGGGLPGIPLKIVRPDLNIVLCDSIGKKIVAVQSMLDALGFTDVRAISHRAEVLAKRDWHAKYYDVIISRAVAQLDDLVTWTKPIMKYGATLLSLKGGDLTEEIARTKKLKGVRTAEELPLALKNYDDFIKEEKKVIRVTMLL